MEHKHTEFYNFVIVGAGPAGLTAAITAARLGLKVLIIEKGEIAGPRPRGEGMGHYPIVDEILGKGFLPSIGLKSNGGRVWHSPGDIQKFTTYKEYDHYFFEWREFIDKFVKVANEEKVEILYKSEVIESIDEEGFTIGVKYKDENGSVKNVFGQAILDCSGYFGVIGSKYGINYNDMNCPIVKCLISKANLNLKDTPDLQFYFMGNGDLEYAPKFPPSVAYVFPLENRCAEVGLMLRMAQVPQMRSVEVPNESEILAVWDKLKKSYPGFSTFFKGAQIDYEEVTYLPNAKMANNFVPNPGSILIGDAAGFINPFGSSGLYYSMEMASFWVKIIYGELSSINKEEDTKPEFIKDLWTDEKIGQYKLKFENTDAFKEVNQMYNLIGAFEYKIFNRLRISEKINKKWEYITSLLSQA
jgi:flavin-dependent dehydrogenase